MRGTISAVAPDGTYGQIAADDGQRYSYWTSEIRNGRVQVGQMVEFHMQDDQPIDIYIVMPGGPPPPMPPRAGMAQRMPQGMSQGMSQGMQRGMPQGMPQGMSQGGSYPALPAHPMAMPGGSNYWVKLFTSPSGRISRRQFWLHGFLPILGASILLAWIPIIGQIISLLILWGSICIAFKRFHDLGYPGWWSVVYLVPMIAAGVIFAVSFFILSIASLAWTLAEILWGIGIIIALVQFVMVYIRVGQQGPNQYGPDPLAAGY